MKPVLQDVDAVTIPVPDIDLGISFYRDVLGHDPIWRNDATGQAGLRTPGSATEIVLTTRESYEPDWKVASVDAAAELFAANGGKVIVEPIDIPIGRLAVVEDPFGNRLVLLDSTKGTYDTDDSGAVIGVSWPGTDSAGMSPAGQPRRHYRSRSRLSLRSSLIAGEEARDGCRAFVKPAVCVWPPTLASAGLSWDAVPGP